MVRKCGCKKVILYDLPCQGVSGHEGPHWSYNNNGFLIQWKNRNDKSPEWNNIAIKNIPPTHKSYIHPKDLYEKSYMHIKIQEEIKKDVQNRR